MREFDDVILIRDREEYAKHGIKRGRIGYICMPEIRDDSLFVAFEDEGLVQHRNDPDDSWFDTHEIEGDIAIEVKIEDVELYQENHLSDEDLLDSLPKHNPEWWCIVEDGYIKNLLGEKKNKIPYDYNS